MHPLAELQKLLTPAKPQTSGTVIFIDGDKVSVATPKGVVVAARRDITNYHLGDRVILNGTELAGKSADESKLPVFFI